MERLKGNPYTKNWQDKVLKVVEKMVSIDSQSQFLISHKSEYHHTSTSFCICVVVFLPIFMIQSFKAVQCSMLSSLEPMCVYSKRQRSMGLSTSSKGWSHATTHSARYLLNVSKSNTFSQKYGQYKIIINILLLTALSCDCFINMERRFAKFATSMCPRQELASYCMRCQVLHQQGVQYDFSI